MITGLMEGTKMKADLYWPDEENKMMELGNDVTVEYLETSFQGTYFHRYMR